MQAFGVRHDLYHRGTLNFCVTDGTVYIGAKYEYRDSIELDNYNLVQITAKFDDRFHPMYIFQDAEPSGRLKLYPPHSKDWLAILPVLCRIISIAKQEEAV